MVVPLGGDSVLEDGGLALDTAFAVGAVGGLLGFARGAANVDPHDNLLVMGVD